MSEKQIRQLIMLGVAGAAVYYLFFRGSSAMAIPGPVAITPRVTALPPAQAQPVSLSPGWLTAGGGGPQVAGW